MASGLNTLWEIDGQRVETVSDFIFLGSKITEDGDCSHEIKRCLLLGRKVMTNLDSILKSRDITFPTKIRLVKAMVLPVVMTSLVAQMVKHLSTVQETGLRSLDWEDLLEKEMAIHPRTIAWKIPWTEKPGRLQSMGSQRVGHDWATWLLFTMYGCESWTVKKA